MPSVASKRRKLQANGYKSQLISEQQAAKAWMLGKLKASGLNAEDAAVLGYAPRTEEESEALNLPTRIIRKTDKHIPHTGPGAGFLMPYKSQDGELLPMWRYRYQHTEMQSGFLKGTELNKYTQPVGEMDIYLPHLPGTNWPAIARDTSIPLGITEGEIKSACGTKHIGIPFIGLGGVWSFGRSARYQELLPGLLAFKWEGRVVYICYDSGAIRNPNVMAAENRLARLLTDRGAKVSIVRLPDDGKDEVKLDDYIVKHGKDSFDGLLARAGEWGPVKELYRLNEEVVHIQHPSMILVYPQENHPEDQPRYRMLKVRVFESELYADRRYTVATQTTGGKERKEERNAAADWVKWKRHSKADSITYAPGQPRIVNGQFNMWEGWGAEPAKGDIGPFTELIDSYIFKDADPAHREWFLQWLAYPLQNPLQGKLFTAVVMWSLLQGSGKSFIGYTMQRIYGRSFHDLKQNELESDFNSWAAYRQFVMGDEITSGNARGLADKLKGLITQETNTINEKHIPRFTVTNYVNYYFTSNHPDAFFLEDNDRRYFVHEIKHKAPDTFWQHYDKWIHSRDGVNALFYHLQREVSLKGFNPKAAAPMTTAKQQMIKDSYSEADRWAHELAEIPDNVLGELTGTLFSTAQLLEIYSYTPSRQSYGLTQTGLGRALRKAGLEQVNNGNAVAIPDQEKRVHLWPIRDRERLAKMTVPQLAAEYAAQLRGVKPPKHA